MAKFYTLSPDRVPENPVLFPNIRPTFIANGHVFVDRIEECDVVLLDLHTRVADYKESDIDWVLNNRVPMVTFDEWDRGGMSEDSWPYPLTKQQREIFNHYQDNKKPIRWVHFCRLMSKGDIYAYPYEKPIFYEEPLLTPDELFNREWDIIYLANSAPSRNSIAEAIKKDGRFKYVISLGQEKIPFEQFLNIHKQGKMFISSGAGGATDERCQCLFSIAGIIRERSNQLLLDDFLHLENCLRIDSPPTKKDLDCIFDVVNDKEKLYKIYKNGVDFMQKKFTPEYFASYVLHKMKDYEII